MNKKDIRIGQTVVLEPYGDQARYSKEPKEATITKIGRQYVYVEIYRDRPMAFDIETGWEKTNYSSEWRLFPTRQDYEDEQDSYALRKRMRETFDWICTVPLDKLRRIAAILDEQPEQAESEM